VGRADTGRTDWERRLIERLRLNHYSWRTEQTYREWAWRLHQFVGKKGAQDATGEDIRNFLTQLAVKGRVSISTQKQALNALVFLFREALARDPGASSPGMSCRGAGAVRPRCLPKGNASGNSTNSREPLGSWHNSCTEVVSV